MRKNLAYVVYEASEVEPRLVGVQLATRLCCLQQVLDLRAQGV